MDYEEEFREMKSALYNLAVNHFLDYKIDWTLCVDASKVTVGARHGRVRMAR